MKNNKISCISIGIREIKVCGDKNCLYRAMAIAVIGIPTKMRLRFTLY